MLAEVAKIKRLSYERDALRLIKEQPEIVSSLSMTWKDYTDIKKYPIGILSIDEMVMDIAVEISKNHGLLISDSAHVAVINSNGIINIASNDSDFEGVKGIKVWSP
jgi:predicted nucleic acid-binding protein